jgi:DNA-binding NtrC family response regulator
MPLKTGMDLLSDLRSQYSQVPFVIVTGYDDKESLLGAIRLGATDFIEKPFKPKQLLEVMERALDLGLGLSQLEGGLELLYSQSKLPSEKIDHIRKVRAAILAMKYENANFRRKVS